MLKVRLMEPADVAEMVVLHSAAFPGFFLTRLGPRFLASYYAGICDLPDGVCHVIRASNGGELLGFVAGSDRPGRFYKSLLTRRWYTFATPAIRYVLLHPKSLNKILRSFLHPKRSETASGVGAIFSIAVNPVAQGQGIGQRLLAEFEESMLAKDMSYIRLETDAIDNESVNAFYSKLGFVKQREFESSGGRLMNDYLLKIDRSARS